MAQDMRENGMRPLIKEMAEAIKYGLMDHYMKVIGGMTKLMVEVD